MLIRKVMKILFTLIIELGFFANSVVISEFCFCGTGCPYSLQNNTNAKIKTLFHGQCPPGQCKSCDIEYYNNKVKASNSSKTTFQIKILNPISKIYTFSDPYCQNIVVKILAFVDTRVMATPSTIFLQNLSILC
jgi:hypothetical protein